MGAEIVGMAELPVEPETAPRADNAETMDLSGVPLREGEYIDIRGKRYRVTSAYAHKVILKRAK